MTDQKSILFISKGGEQYYKETYEDQIAIITKKLTKYARLTR